MFLANDNDHLVDSESKARAILIFYLLAALRLVHRSNLTYDSRFAILLDKGKVGRLHTSHEPKNFRKNSDH